MPATLTLSLAIASLIAAQAQTRPTSQLVPGKFGKALDAAITPLAFGGDERYRTPPLTVECWARLNSKNSFNVLVSSDPKTSSRHWEIYSYAASGAFAAYLPGYEPAEVVSKTNICDRQWHHLAFTFDGKIASLFVDGKKVHEQAVKPRPGARPDSGPLSVGQAIDSVSRVGCDGLIDEVHLSRVVRPITGIPTKPPVVDADTIGLWRFDDSEQILADPAWTPIPNTTGEAWERETDVDWVDARLRKMDTGPTFNGTMSYPIAKGRALVYKGTAIRLGDRGEAGVMFDRNQLRLAAAWTGGFLEHSDRRFGLLNTPSPVGKLIHTYPASSTTAPLPPEKGRYNGLYLNGSRAILSYTLEGVEVLESPWLEKIAGRDVIKRSFEVGPAAKDLVLPVQDALVTGDGQAQENLSVEKDGKGNWTLRLPASPRTRRFTLYHWHGGDKEDPKSVFKGVTWPAPLDLRALTRPGPGRWGAPLETRGEIAKDTAPFVVDTLTVPYDNRFNALFFTAGHDFLPDGRIAVCTAHGDVWLVQTDDKLEKVSWRRFATGLYHPLGLKVVDGKVVVLERGQLTRLHDDNNDGEADRHENLCNDWHTGAGEHSYDTCLETDSAGNFYFFKTGDTDLPHGGCLMRVSKDGKNVEVFSTGFRHPIGLGVSPADVVTGADQEGNWMPVTRVDIYKKAGFYGDMRAHHRAAPPKIYDGPLLWLPKNVDNSAGGQVWVPHDRFGFPRGQMLHLSYGRCKLYALLQQKVGDVDQAGAVDLGVKFLSGSARGRFHPENGHLYVTGLRGWQTGAQRDGCLQRVRHTGQPLPMPIGLSAHGNGLRLDFAQELDPASIDKARFSIEQWNYRWSADYGSKYWSVRQPDRQGRDSLVVEQATLSPDRKKVFLTVKGLGPVMQMRIGYQVKTSSGRELTGSVHNTIHRLGETQSISRGNAAIDLGILAIGYLTTGFHAVFTQENGKRAELLLREVTLPPPGTASKDKTPAARPSLGRTDLDKYADSGEPQMNLRERLEEARMLLWVSSPAMPPKYLIAEVQKRRRDLKTPALFADQLPIPTTPQVETRLKTQLMDNARLLARIVASLEKTVDELKELREQRDRENIRWQANYDLTLAWLMQRIVYLEELSLTLGQMRKEWPVYDAAVHKNWQAQPSDRLRDIPTKKRAREAEKLLKDVMDKYPDTIWATLANDALKAPLSLEWKPVK